MVDFRMSSQAHAEQPHWFFLLIELELDFKAEDVEFADREKKYNLI
jgi:hypothetical protein